MNAINTGASLIRVEPGEDPFHMNLVSVTTAIEANHPQLVYLVSPNNPTGVQWPKGIVQDIATRYKLVFIEKHFLPIQRCNIYYRRGLSRI